MAETAPTPEAPSALSELLTRIRQLSTVELRAAAASIEGLLTAKVPPTSPVADCRSAPPPPLSHTIDLGVSFDEDQNPFGVSDAAKKKQPNTWD